jgi:serine protease Do
MSKKSVLVALVLITVGIIFGVVLVSTFDGGVAPGFARGGGDVVLGGPVPVSAQSEVLRALGENFTAVAKAVTPSVVAITVTTEGRDRGRSMPRDFFHFFGPDFEPPPSQGYGSGVIMTADGYIATNNHVVEGAKDGGIEVLISERNRFRAKLIGHDPSTDLAVIKIEARDLPAAALGNSDNVQVGEWVLAIGNPLGLTSTVTAGIISAIGRNISIIRDTYGIENFIQTDAAINPGNSGGALVNMKGEVVGINTAIATTSQRYQGYGFAVPVNLLKVVAADLIKYGEVRRGYIGVQISGVDQTMASALGMQEPTGVLVNSVVRGGAAETAGVKDGDVILSIDGRTIAAPNELQTYVATRHPGDAVKLKLFRGGKTLEKTVTLQPRADQGTTVPASEPAEEGKGRDESSPRALSFEKLGFSVRSLTPDEKGELGVDRGVLVTEVTPYGEAFNRAIRQNQIILEADRKDISTPAQLRQVIDGHKPGDSILLRIRQGEDFVAFVALQIPK